VGLCETRCPLWLKINGKKQHSRGVGEGGGMAEPRARRVISSMGLPHPRCNWKMYEIRVNSHSTCT
jgi:hypothetical protein